MKKTKLTRSLLAACSIVALSAVMYGCTTRRGPSKDEPMEAMDGDGGGRLPRLTRGRRCRCQRRPEATAMTNEDRADRQWPPTADAEDAAEGRRGPADDSELAPGQDTRRRRRATTRTWMTAAGRGDDAADWMRGTGSQTTGEASDNADERTERRRPTADESETRRTPPRMAG